MPSTRTITHQTPGRMLEILLHDMEPAIERLVLDALTPYLWLVPSWCRKLAVQIGENGEAYAGTINVDVEYRQARIKLAPDVFTSREGWLAEVLAHELVHVLTAPMAELGEELAKRVDIQTDGPAKGLIQNRWTEAVESVTSDLSLAVHHFTRVIDEATGAGLARRNSSTQSMQPTPST